MKKFIAITATLLISGATLEAHASLSSCDSVEHIASSIMDARQKGAPMSEMMAIAGDNELVQDMVIDAYRHGAYRSPDIRARAIRDFADKHYRMCVEILRAAE